MLTLRVVQARYGDCLILENGSGKRRRNVLIDGGPGKVYRPYLRKELERINAEGGQIDLLVLTHIDNDHVLGLLELMTEIKEQRAAGEPDVVRIRSIWHNAFKQILPEAGVEAELLEADVLAQPVKNPPADAEFSIGAAAFTESSGSTESSNTTESSNSNESGTAEDGSELDQLGGVEFGVGEGVRLQLADELLRIPRNAGIGQGLVTLESTRRPERLAALRLWVFAPNAENLGDLRQKWMRWLDDKAGRVSFDISQPVVDPDDSVNNLSSIMLLAEARGRTILLTGDGRSQDIIAGLEAIGKLPPGGTCHVDVMKVPHHGSARNAVGELFDRVLADMYVFSADGKYGNPDWQTLVWLVDAACRQEREIHIFATNWTPSLRQLLSRRPPESNHYRLTVMPEDQSSFVL
jgi:beta-lactamase superfamily II metal-dependent hydrolase